MNSRTGVTLSPNEKIVLTGTSVRKGYSVAQVAGFSTVTGENICRIPSSAHSVISIVWHPQLNQIFTGSADTTIRVLYDPEKSRGGIMKCVTK
jgi:WD40 repeat protein